MVWLFASAFQNSISYLANGNLIVTRFGSHQCVLDRGLSGPESQHLCSAHRPGSLLSRVLLIELELWAHMGSTGP